jgi:hypothetical protein
MSDGITEANRKVSKEQIINHELMRLKALVKEIQSSIDYLEIEFNQIQ